MNAEFKTFGNKTWSISDRGITYDGGNFSFEHIMQCEFKDTTSSFVNGFISVVFRGMGKHKLYFTVSQREIAFRAYNEINEKRDSIKQASTYTYGEMRKELDEKEESMLYLFDGGLKDVLEIYEDYIVIKHRGVVNAISMGVKGDKRIYYADLTSVQLCKPIKFVSGYIQFSLKGANESTKGIFGAMSDENSVAVIGNSPIVWNRAEEAVRIINEKLMILKTNKNVPTQVISQISGADEIIKYKQLLDAGIISQDEFDAKKKQLLGL